MNLGDVLNLLESKTGMDRGRPLNYLIAGTDLLDRPLGLFVKDMHRWLQENDPDILVQPAAFSFSISEERHVSLHERDVVGTISIKGIAEKWRILKYDYLEKPPQRY